MELMDMSSKLEMVNTSKNWLESNKDKTQKEIWDCLFSEAFGAFWNESEIMRIVREYIPQIMNIVNHPFCKGYLTVIYK
jgi:hypothetical protein